MHTRTCVAPGGKFVFGIHKPAYGVSNFRKNDFIRDLGKFSDGRPYQNRVNFPEKDVSVEAADWVYEIPNPLPFRGVT